MRTMMRVAFCLLLSVTFAIRAAEPSGIAGVSGPSGQLSPGPAGHCGHSAKDLGSGPGTDVAVNTISPRDPRFGELRCARAAGPVLPIALDPPGGRLEKTAFVARGRLGVRVMTAAPELAEALGMPEQEGALVVIVDKDGPAANAGIVRGDVILQLDGKPVGRAEDLAAAIGGRVPGTTVRLGIWRNHELRSVRARLGFW